MSQFSTPWALIADADDGRRSKLVNLLETHEFRVTVVAAEKDMLAALEPKTYAIVLVACETAGDRASDLIRRICSRDPETLVVPIITGATSEIALELFRNGVFDFVDSASDIDVQVASVMARARPELERLAALREKIAEYHKRIETLEQSNRFLKNLSVRDGLTGLYNQRYFHEELAYELFRAGRNKSRFSLLFVEIVSFDHYQARHGEVAANFLLRRVGQELKKSLRKTDLLALCRSDRIAGILPETGRQVARNVAARIDRHLTDLLKSQATGTTENRVAIQIGLATYPDNGSDGSTLISHAERALAEDTEHGDTSAAVTNLRPDDDRRMENRRASGRQNMKS